MKPSKIKSGIFYTDECQYTTTVSVVFDEEDNSFIIEFLFKDSDSNTIFAFAAVALIFSFIPYLNLGGIGLLIAYSLIRYFTAKKFRARFYLGKDTLYVDAQNKVCGFFIEKEGAKHFAGFSTDDLFVDLTAIKSESIVIYSKSKMQYRLIIAAIAIFSLMSSVLIS
jgi:hypothetical protein